MMIGSTFSILLATAAATEWTLVDALARAAGHGPDVRVATAREAEAEATRVGAGVIVPTKPRVQAEVRPPIGPGGGNVPGFAALADVSLEWSGAGDARLAEAERRVEHARARTQLARIEAMDRTYRAYVAAQVAELRRKNAEETVALARRLRDAARTRAEAGGASELDVAPFELQLAQAEVELVTIGRERADALAELRFLLDLEAGQAVALLTPVDAPVPVPDVAALRTAAAERRPELREARALQALFAAADERLAREAAPRVGTYLGVDAAPASPVFGQVGLSFELPMFQVNQGPRAVAAAARAAEETRTATEERRVIHELEATSARYAARLRELDALDRRALPVAERALALVEDGFRAGRFDVFRVVLASQELLRTRRDRLDVLRDAWLDHAALLRAAAAFP